MHKDGTNAPSLPRAGVYLARAARRIRRIRHRRISARGPKTAYHLNAMALLIVVFSVIYAAVFAYYDARAYHNLIVVNLLLTVIVLLVASRASSPFRRGESARRCPSPRSS